jgi:hypothetical protein
MNELQKTSNPLSFEDFKNENGITYWWASDLMIMLGYKDMKSFHKVLDRATKAFVSLNIPHYENIISEQREINGNKSQDFKLSRFACYLTVMNGDPKKIEVAQAQVYFAQQTRKFELHIEHFQVGKEVREIIKKNAGKNPENLIQEKQLSEVKKELKQGHRKMLKEDTNKNKK